MKAKFKPETKHGPHMADVNSSDTRLRRLTQSQKRLILAVAHTVACLGFLWAFYPRPTADNLQTIEGVPTIYKSGARITSTSFKVGGILMSCSPGALGPSHICSTRFLPGVSATATYFRMQTVMSVLGGGQGTAILIKLEQNNELIMSNTKDDLASSYQWNSLLEIMFFAISYFSFIKLKFFKEVN